MREAPMILRSSRRRVMGADSHHMAGRKRARTGAVRCEPPAGITLHVRSIDLNADVGEGAGDDAALLQVVTSANVACGFHAGDVATMRRTCEAAVARGVVIGAHVGYRDREHFGRRDLDVPAAVLGEEAREQLRALAAAAADAGGAVRYVKPHGALYHRCSTDAAAAAAVVAATGLCIVGAPGSALLDAAREAG